MPTLSDSAWICEPTQSQPAGTPTHISRPPMTIIATASRALAPPRAARVAEGVAGGGHYLICMPEIAREITSRWISEVPSKIV